MILQKKTYLWVRNKKTNAMKHLFLLLAAGLMAVSCIFSFGGGTMVGFCTEEGIDFTDVRDVDPFHALSSSLPCNVYYEQADVQEVRVESTEEFAGKVLTEVEDGTLKLKLEPGRYPKLILRVVVSSPDIESLRVSGSGNLVNEGGLRTGGGMDLKVSGSGDIRTGAIDSKDFTAHCSGSGSLRVDRISCTGFSATVGGSGSIVAQTLQAHGKVSARISGSGRIRLEDATVDGDMVLSTSGSGSITVNGSCHDVTATTSGSGSISGNLAYDHISTHTSGSGQVRL